MDALHRKALALLPALLLSCGQPTPAIPPTPPASIPSPLRLLSHADRPAELLVFDHRSSRRFVAEVALALDEVNRARAPGGDPVALTVLHWKHDRGEAELPPTLRTPTERVAVAGRFDVWAQDFVEIAVAGQGSETRVVLLDPYRGAGLEGFVPELALRWHADWLRLSPAPRGSASGAGNLEALPDGTVLLGSTAGPAWTQLLVERAEPGRLLPVETSWLAVGHVDEILSHVVTGPERCGFALVRASSGRGLELARAQGSAPRWLRRRLDEAGFVRTQETLEARLAASAREVSDAIVANGCPPPSVLTLPALFDCEGDPAAPHGCRSVLPSAVNMTVLDRHALVPEPGYAPFRDATRRTLEEAGQSVHLIEADFHHAGRGGVHCATNVRRLPRNARR